MPAKPKLNPSQFPRPPKLERTTRQLAIKHNGQLIASTRGGDDDDAYWVLETYHPPTYYLPLSSVQPAFRAKLARSSYTSFCEWKGRATYWDLTLSSAVAESGSTAGSATAAVDSPAKEQVIKNRIWSYENPTQGFESIKDYLSFYAGPWQCFVDDEEVMPQPGDFYGGWTTSDIDTKYVKGAAGTRHW